MILLKISGESDETVGENFYNKKFLLSENFLLLFSMTSMISKLPKCMECNHFFISFKDKILNWALKHLKLEATYNITVQTLPESSIKPNARFKKITMPKLQGIYF